MKKLKVPLVALSMLALVFGTLGCAREETQLQTATLTLPGEGESVGSYTCVFVHSEVTAVEGRVFLQGEPLANWIPASEWPVNYPPTLAGQILVMFNVDTSRQKYQYSQPGEVWQLNHAESEIGFSLSVDYIAQGYLHVRIEDVPIHSGMMTILPDVTLIPLWDEWVFRPENQ